MDVVFQQVARGAIGLESFTLSFGPWSMRYGSIIERRQKIVLYIVGLPLHGWNEDSIKFAFNRYGEIIKSLTSLRGSPI